MHDPPSGESKSPLDRSRQFEDSCLISFLPTAPNHAKSVDVPGVSDCRSLKLLLSGTSLGTRSKLEVPGKSSFSVLISVAYKREETNVVFFLLFLFLSHRGKLALLPLLIPFNNS